MPREPEAYRDNIAAIKELFPNQIMFRPKEVCQITGMKKYDTVVRHFTFTNGYISIGDLARQMSYTESRAKRKIM